MLVTHLLPPTAKARDNARRAGETFEVHFFAQCKIVDSSSRRRDGAGPVQGRGDGPVALRDFDRPSRQPVEALKLEEIMSSAKAGVSARPSSPS